MVFEPPGYEPDDYEPADFEPWATGAIVGDPARHPDPDLTAFVEVGPTVAVFIEV
jgi:hypothetical protein